MRSAPHPMRMVWKTAQLVMVGSIMTLVLVALRSGARVDNGSEVSVPLGWLVVISFLVTALTTRRAGLQAPVLRMWPGTATVFIARPPEVFTPPSPHGARRI